MLKTRPVIPLRGGDAYTTGRPESQNQNSHEEGAAMIFVSVYSIAPEKRNAAQERFKKSGGPPPKGVKMIGRWHAVGGGRGVTVFEADDAQTAAHWAQQWTDLISFEIYPAIDDAGFAKLIG
jgi:hypothetical protein